MTGDLGHPLAVTMCLAFAFTNGVHDSANAVAGLVMTRAARPLAAVTLAAAGNLAGPALVGQAVASTVAGIAAVPSGAAVATVGAAATAAVVWNAMTWWLGLPSSSGQALVGGLVGAAVASSGVGAVHWGGGQGLRPDGVSGVALGLVASPLLGFVMGLVGARVVVRSLRRASRRVAGPARIGQWLAALALAVGHGANDAGKAMGLLAVLLAAEQRAPLSPAPPWVVLATGCALTLGTALGGWRIVATVGRRLYRLRPIDGLVGTAGSALAMLCASVAGLPASTSQVVAASMVGTGVGRRRSRHVHWTLVRTMSLGWVTTVPACAIIAAVAVIPWSVLA